MRKRERPASLARIDDDGLLFEWPVPESEKLRILGALAQGPPLGGRSPLQRRQDEVRATRERLFAEYGRATVLAEAARRCAETSTRHREHPGAWCPRCGTTGGA